MLKQVLTGTISGSGIFPLSGLAALYPGSAITKVGNTLVVPEDSFYIITFRAFNNNNTSLSDISVRVNGTDRTSSSGGQGSMWQHVTFCGFLFAGDAISFYSTLSIGFNIGGSVMCAQLFTDVADVIPSLNASVRTCSSDSTVLNVWPLVSTGVAQYGTETSSSGNNAFATVGNAEFVCYSSCVEVFANDNPNIGFQLNIATYGECTVNLLLGTSTKFEWARTEFFPDQNTQTFTKTIFSGGYNYTMYEGAQTALVKLA